MDKEYMVMDDKDYPNSNVIIPEYDDESKRIVAEIMEKFGLKAEDD